MAAVTIDSNVLIDYKDTGAGARHERAQAIVHAIDSGEVPTAHVHESVLLETLNWIHDRRRHDIAVDLRQRLSESPGFQLVAGAQADFRRAIDLFETYDGLAFGDATIVAYLQRTGIEHLYSFDDDFDVFEDVTRLSTAHHPDRP